MPDSHHKPLIVGAGIGALSLAIGLANKKVNCTLLEQSQILSEVGAGIQLGANVTKLLKEWQLEKYLQAVAFYPRHLLAYDGLNGQCLASYDLGANYIKKYKAPYLTIARADLHQILLNKTMQNGNTQLELGQRIIETHDINGQVQLISATEAGNKEWMAPAVIGADGIHSIIRQAIMSDGPAYFTRHIAYRAMLKMTELPAWLRKSEVCVWMGKKFHIVHYPVKGGDWLNLVVLIAAKEFTLNTTEKKMVDATHLKAQLTGACKHINTLLEAVAIWNLWPLFGRHPIRSTHDLSQKNIALLGDAAHPMLPYLAQGGAMAIEDAWTLATCYGQHKKTENAFQHYANARWVRCAAVQKKAIANGGIFHATGLKRLVRNTLLRSMGEKLMDQPWLYHHHPWRNMTSDALKR